MFPGRLMYFRQQKNMLALCADIEFDQAVAPVHFIRDGIQLRFVLSINLPQSLEPWFECTEASGLQHGHRRTTVVMTAHDDVLDIQMLDTIDYGGPRVRVERGHQVADVAVDEHFPRSDAHEGFRHNPAVRTSDVEYPGLRSPGQTLEVTGIRA